MLAPALAAALLVACGDAGRPDAGEPATAGSAPVPTHGPVTAPTPRLGTAVLTRGFASVAARVTRADGTVCELCLWRAVTDDEHRRGLSGVTELGGADGMVFVFENDVTVRFWMRDIPMPLDIVWFGAEGAFVSSASMTPCLDGDAADCARYESSGPYRYAVELPAGTVAALGVGPGSVLTLEAVAGCADAVTPRPP